MTRTCGGIGVKPCHWLDGSTCLLRAVSDGQGVSPARRACEFGIPLNAGVRRKRYKRSATARTFAEATNRLDKAWKAFRAARKAARSEYREAMAQISASGA